MRRFARPSCQCLPETENPALWSDSTKEQRTPQDHRYRQCRADLSAGIFREQVKTCEDLEDLLGGIGDFVGRRSRSAGPARVEAAVDVTLEEAFTGAKRKVTISSRGEDRRIEVSIPPGVDTGSVVRISPGGGQELLLTITVAPQNRFDRKGAGDGDALALARRDRQPTIPDSRFESLGEPGDELRQPGRSCGRGDVVLGSVRARVPDVLRD